ncbi:hypothetical protein MPH_10817 [Macrophomina phaseolina MS6]|uniref:DUF7029 domain-containing protein n=1 Tax=Macrophomina phaseolina (strain MS6) TaxID=1126212 RepID=K2S5U0_MACPH|nr:hypothetical protein MPH_10817 [Macrophomina phaseolina MS6]
MGSIKPFLTIYAVWLLACLPHGVLSAAGSSRALGAAPMLDLKAATRRSDNLRRSDQIRTSKFVDLLYADADNTGSRKSVFFSRVQAQSSKQVLMLEDIEDQLNHIECTKSGIELGFRNNDVFNDVEGAISGLEGGYVVAAHAGCNEEGSRAVFQVECVTASEDTNTITLAATKKHWKEAFNHFNIDYGYSNEHHELRRHQFERRQEATSQAPAPTQAPIASGATPSTSTSAFLSHTTIVPSNASQVTATSVALNLFHEEANTTFALPPGLVMALSNTHFTLGCKHCKTTGNFNLTQGNWELDWPDMDEIVQMDSVADVFRMGFVQLALTDFNAYIELQASPAESGGLIIPLFTAPTVGFRIPELGTAGVMFEPALTFNWALTGGIRMSYGFNLTVPSAIATLNFTDLDSSNVKGLENYTLEALPFQANISDIELQLHVALRPRIELAFSLFDNELLAEAGTYLDLPIANVNITQLASAQHNSNCESVEQPPADEADFEQSFSNLTHIAAGVDIGVGVDLRMQAELPVLKDPAFATSWSIASMPATTLPTACLVYQTGAPVGAAFTPAATKLAAMKKEKEQRGGVLGGSGQSAAATPGVGMVLSLVVNVVVLWGFLC